MTDEADYRFTMRYRTGFTDWRYPKVERVIVDEDIANPTDWYISEDALIVHPEMAENAASTVGVTGFTIQKGAVKALLQGDPQP